MNLERKEGSTFLRSIFIYSPAQHLGEFFQTLEVFQEKEDSAVRTQIHTGIWIIVGDNLNRGSAIEFSCICIFKKQKQNLLAWTDFLSPREEENIYTRGRLQVESIFKIQISWICLSNFTQTQYEITYSKKKHT